MFKCVISIVTWNSEKYLRECVKACLAQTESDYRVVIVDNNSTDGTRTIIEEFGDRVSTILSPVNTGFSGGHNLTFKNFLAEYYCVLNPDVFLDAEYIANSIGFLDKNSAYGGIIGKVFQCIYKDGEFEKVNIIDTCGLGVKKSYHFFAVDNGAIDEPERKINRDIFGVDGMCPIYRRTMLDSIQVNGEYFDEFFFAYCEDQDLSWRARNKGWKFAFVPAAKAYHVRTWKPATLSGRKQINKNVRKMALRNHYLMLVRNLDSVDFIKASPFIFWRMIKIVGYCLLFERFTLRAYVETAANFKKYYKMRARK